MTISIILTLILNILFISPVKAGNLPIEGRYSFSCTTFDPSGKLKQVEHAITASTKGPPLIAVILPHDFGVFLMSLQTLPSPLTNDDGTTRFVRISKNIVMGHSGIPADGRKVCAMAQRLSVDHTYTFDEEIPMDMLLEELSLLYQEQTMNAGCRPWGCTVLLANIRKECGKDTCRIYTMDPSGSAWEWKKVAIIGREMGIMIREKIVEIIENVTSIEEGKRLIRYVLEKEWTKDKWGRNREKKETENFIEGLLTPETFVMNRRSFGMIY